MRNILRKQPHRSPSRGSFSNPTREMDGEHPGRGVTARARAALLLAVVGVSLVFSLVLDCGRGGRAGCRGADDTTTMEDAEIMAPSFVPSFMQGLCALPNDATTQPVMTNGSVGCCVRAEGLGWAWAWACSGAAAGAGFFPSWTTRHWFQAAGSCSVIHGCRV